MFASAFGAFDSQTMLKRYHDVFEKKDDPDELPAFVPETEQDVAEMLAVAKRTGAIT